MVKSIKSNCQTLDPLKSVQRINLQLFVFKIECDDKSIPEWVELEERLFEYKNPCSGFNLSLS